MNHKIIFTGGPGSGKTSTIAYLESLGYKSVSESGRKIIQQQMKIKSPSLPWENKESFRDLMVSMDINNYKICNYKYITFFDRGIIDSYGYSQLESIKISETLLKSCKELLYNKNVFIFPPWKSIYLNDDERKQDFDDAIATYKAIKSAYKKFKYRLIEVPRLPVKERAKFILNKIIISKDQ